MPPPITSILAGISSKASAPVEFIIRGSLAVVSSKPGKSVACEPAAIMAFSNPIVVTLPAVSVTAI